MSQFTPGEWWVGQSGLVHVKKPDGVQSLIPLISPWQEDAFDESDEEALANMRLIAAAPELYMAAKGLLSAISGMYIEFADREDQVRNAEQQVRAALAKAEGASR